MDPKQIMSASYEDIIFENRYKDYGAYNLRTTYSKRVRNALLAALFFTVAFISYPIIMRMLNEQEDSIVIEKNTIVNEMVAPPPLDEATPPPPEVKLPQIEQIKFVPPKIVETVTKEEEIKTIEEVKQATNIGTQDVEGTKEIITEPVKEIIKEVEKKEEEPLLIVEKMPSFPGGDGALYKFIQENMRYPQAAQDYNIQGTVYVQFVVGKDGKIKDAKVLKDIGGGCGTEAIRVVNMLPPWNPGEQAGRNVPVIVKMPIKFQLR